MSWIERDPCPEGDNCSNPICKNGHPTRPCFHVQLHKCKTAILGKLCPFRHIKVLPLCRHETRKQCNEILSASINRQGSKIICAFRHTDDPESEARPKVDDHKGGHFKGGDRKGGDYKGGERRSGPANDTHGSARPHKQHATTSSRSPPTHAHASALAPAPVSLPPPAAAAVFTRAHDRAAPAERVARPDEALPFHARVPCPPAAQRYVFPAPGSCGAWQTELRCRLAPSDAPGVFRVQAVSAEALAAAEEALQRLVLVATAATHDWQHEAVDVAMADGSRLAIGAGLVPVGPAQRATTAFVTAHDISTEVYAEANAADAQEDVSITRDLCVRVGWNTPAHSGTARLEFRSAAAANASMLRLRGHWQGFTLEPQGLGCNDLALDNAELPALSDDLMYFAAAHNSFPDDVSDVRGAGHGGPRFLVRVTGISAELSAVSFRIMVATLPGLSSAAVLYEHCIPGYGLADPEELPPWLAAFVSDDAAHAPLGSFTPATGAHSWLLWPARGDSAAELADLIGRSLAAASEQSDGAVSAEVMHAATVQLPRALYFTSLAFIVTQMSNAARTIDCGRPAVGFAIHRVKQRCQIVLATRSDAATAAVASITFKRVARTEIQVCSAMANFPAQAALAALRAATVLVRYDAARSAVVVMSLSADHEAAVTQVHDLNAQLEQGPDARCAVVVAGLNGRTRAQLLCMVCGALVPRAFSGGELSACGHSVCAGECARKALAVMTN